MQGLHVTVYVLLVILLLVAILAVMKLISVLDQVQKTVESTRKDVDQTIARVDTLIRDEITPTLKVTRETLEHVEVTTHAVADATQAARRVAATIDSFVDSKAIARLGTKAAGFALKQGAKLARGVVTGIGSTILGGRKRQAAQNGAPKALPARTRKRAHDGTREEAHEK